MSTLAGHKLHNAISRSPDSLSLDFGVTLSHFWPYHVPDFCHYLIDFFLPIPVQVHILRMGFSHFFHELDSCHFAQFIDFGVFPTESSYKVPWQSFQLFSIGYVGDFSSRDPEHVSQFIEMVKLLSNLLQRVFLVVAVDNSLFCFMTYLSNWTGFFLSAFHFDRSFCLWVVLFEKLFAEINIMKQAEVDKL